MIEFENDGTFVMNQELRFTSNSIIVANAEAINQKVCSEMQSHRRKCLLAALRSLRNDSRQRKLYFKTCKAKESLEPSGYERLRYMGLFIVRSCMLHAPIIKKTEYATRFLIPWPRHQTFIFCSMIGIPAIPGSAMVVVR